MSTLIQAVRGMNDILPPDTALWQQVEAIFRRSFQSYGYQEIRTPYLEKTQLFKRSIGEVTDIVEKEMYTFEDRNGESLTLRPEGTACCVRAVLEHGLLHNQVQRLWYSGAYFRHERPQKGRYRQFHQFTAEVFGLPGPDIDAELISLSAHLLEKLGILPFVTLQLNSLGTKEARIKFREALVNYFTQHQDQLDEEEKNRLAKNPLRLLDSKNPALKSIIAHAPKLLDYLDDESLAHFDMLQNYLAHTGIKFEVNPSLVRGLDYYTKTVFEWTTTRLGAQGTVCGGGRYDGLVAELGGKPTPALGFSFGMERVLLLMAEEGISKHTSHLHAYLMSDGEVAFKAALKLGHYLRNHVHDLRLMLHTGGGSIKNQFKKADKSGAQFAIIIGEHELKTHSVSLKNLREDLPQITMYQDELAAYLELEINKD